MLTNYNGFYQKFQTRAAIKGAAMHRRDLSVALVDFTALAINFFSETLVVSLTTSSETVVLRTSEATGSASSFRDVAGVADVLLTIGILSFVVEDSSTIEGVVDEIPTFKVVVDLNGDSSIFVLLRSVFEGSTDSEVVGDSGIVLGVVVNDVVRGSS